jgi:hypothetical protein
MMSKSTQRSGLFGLVLAIGGLTGSQPSAAASPTSPQTDCGAIAIAPLGARVGVNTTLRGDHSYYIRNVTNQPIVITVTVTLWDSEGGRTANSHPVTVGPGLESRGRLTTFYAKAFGRPGSVHLFAQTEIAGGTAAPYRAQSSFYVSP